MARTKFRVLFVCTANLCRSPMMEYLLSAALAQRWSSAQSGWRVVSAGVDAQPGLPIHERAAGPLLVRRIDTSAFRSRRISEQSIADADLILTASRDHRAAVVTMAPDAMHHTFTLRGFAHLAADVTELEAAGLTSPRDAAAAGRALLEAALGQRSKVMPLDPAHEDLADPMGHRSAAFRKCANQIEQSVTAMLTPLASLDPGYTRPRPLPGS